MDKWPFLNKYKNNRASNGYRLYTEPSKGARSVKKRGFLLSFSTIVVVAIFTCLFGAGIAGGYYAVNSWRGNQVKTQADVIDSALLNYATYHKGIRDSSIKSDTNSGLAYTKSQDYPLYLDNIGQISEKSGGSKLTQDSGFFDSRIQFCAVDENPQQNLYKFKYTALDENGSKITVSSNKPAAYYTLEVYYKNGKGDVIRYVSPRSYENIKDNAKQL